MTKTQYIKSLIVDPRDFRPWFAPAGFQRGKLNIISASDGVGKSIFGKVNV